jgi:peptide/nickel transport system substrate-binding protein
MFMAINHLNPPFDNQTVRQAVVAALDQQVFADSAVGDQREFAMVPTGLFAPTMPMANKAGLDHLTGPRDLDKARKMISGSGYKGEPVVIMSQRPTGIEADVGGGARSL